MVTEPTSESTEAPTELPPAYTEAQTEPVPPYEPIRLVAKSSSSLVLQPVFDQLYELDLLLCQHGNQVHLHLSEEQHKWLGALVDSSPDDLENLVSALLVVLKELYLFFNDATDQDQLLFLDGFPTTSTFKDVMRAKTFVDFIKINNSASVVTTPPSVNQIIAAWSSFPDLKAIDRRFGTLRSKVKNIFSEMKEQALSIKENEQDLGKWNRYLENVSRINALGRAAVFGNDPDKLLKKLNVNKKTLKLPLKLQTLFR